jgi:hypothetical protein
VLSAGAFSDDEVVAATKDVICVYVDLEWGRKHVDLAQRYGVRVMPTVIYADPQGEEVGRMKVAEPAVISAEVATLARDHAKSFR